MTVEMDAPSSTGNSSRSGMRRRPVWVLALFVLTLAVVGWIGWYRQRPPQRFARGLEALAAGRLDQVDREWESLRDAADYQAHRHFLRGASWLQKNQFYRALDEFAHCVEHPDLRLRTLTLAGEAAYRAGHWQDAAGLLQQAVQSNPDCVTSLRWLASAYHDLGLNDDAIVVLTRIAELEPRDARPHRLMGLMYKDFENYQVAIQHYQESLRRDPQQPDREQIVIEWADCQIRLREFESALSLLQRCRPGVGRWVREAECLHGLGRIDDAQKLLEEVLQREPAQLPALLLQGTIASERGDAKAAIDAFSRAVVAQPKDYVAQFKLAQALRRVGDNEAADAHGQAAAEIKRIREEFSKLHETAAAEPGNADVRCRIGVLAREFGRPDLARVWFRAALAVDPRHAETLRHLAGDSP
jgi:tetratricopeptide (TPR) repeat protein